MNDDNSLPLLTYQDIGDHNRKESAFVAYEGLVFDITDFLNHHPGGSAILQTALGTDITDTIDSFHDIKVGKFLLSEEYRDRFEIKLIGRLRTSSEQRTHEGKFSYQSRRIYRRPDPMYDDLRKEVHHFIFKNKLPVKKGIWECIALLAIYWGLLTCAVYFGFLMGSTLWCALLGPIATFMAVNVGHTVMHGGFSNNALVNLLGRCLWDAGGYAACCWDVEHQAHHQAPHTSIDPQTADEVGMRFFEHQEKKWYHQYQMFYLWLLFVFYSPSSWFTHTYKTLFVFPSLTLTDKLLHLGFKLTFFVAPIVLSFFLLDPLLASLNLLVFAISMSYFSIFTLFIQHEDAYLPEREWESWSERQVITSVSWRSNSRVFEWFFGHFNYHIEHHLFPGLNPSLYPKIQPIVKSICKRYGVNYKDISYWELVSSQVRAWRKFSNEAVKSPA